MSSRDPGARDGLAAGQPAQPDGSGAARLLLVAAFALPLVLRCLSYKESILDRDETYWLASAMRMRDAGVPMYVAGWDMKPPAVFGFYRVVLALAPDAPLLVAHVLGAVLCGAACALVAAAARRIAGVLAGLAAAVIFASLDSTGPVRALATNTEVMACAPIAGVCLAMAASHVRPHKAAFLAGVCAAAAALAKLPAAIYGPAACVAVVLTCRDPASAWRSVLLLTAGVVALLLPVLAWLRLSGAWDDFIACNVTISGNRAAMALGLAPDASYARWWAVARANPLAILGCLCVLGAAWSPATGARRCLRALGPLVPAGLVAAFVGGGAYPHYLLLAYAPIACVAGVGVALVLERVRPGRPRAVALFAAGCVLAGAALPARLLQWRSRDWVGYEGPAVRAVSARIAALTTPSDTIFVWGIHPELHVTSRRTPATRFVVSCWLVGTYTGEPPPGRPEPFEFVEGSWDLLFRDLDEQRPALILDSATGGVQGFDAYPIDRFPRLRAWISTRYVREDERSGDFAVWRRADLR